MKSLMTLLLVFMGCSVMTGCGEAQPTVVSEELSEADIENYEEENRRMEEETAAGL